MDINDRRKKLVFRAWHRGTREMDLLLGSFADSFVHTCSPEELDQFEHLLTCQDPDLYDWKCERATPPSEENTPVMRLFLSHKLPPA